MTRMEQIEHQLDMARERLEEPVTRLHDDEALAATQDAVSLLLLAVLELKNEVKAIDRVVTQLANEHP